MQDTVPNYRRKPQKNYKKFGLMADMETSARLSEIDDELSAKEEREGTKISRSWAVYAVWPAFGLVGWLLLYVAGYTGYNAYLGATVLLRELKTGLDILISF